MGTEEVCLTAIPIPGSTAVDSGPPVSVFLPVALPAEPVGFLKGDGGPASQVKNVPVFSIVAVEAPTIILVMFQHDLAVKPGELPSGGVDRDHAVTVGTRINAR